jgi:hypothetical protein
MDMQPIIGTETWRPEFPSRRYSALEFCSEAATLSGRPEEVIMKVEMQNNKVL